MEMEQGINGDGGRRAEAGLPKGGQRIMSNEAEDGRAGERLAKADPQAGDPHEHIDDVGHGAVEAADDDGDREEILKILEDPGLAEVHMSRILQASSRREQLSKRDLRMASMCDSLCLRHQVPDDVIQAHCVPPDPGFDAVVEWDEMAAQLALAFDRFPNVRSLALRGVAESSLLPFISALPPAPLILNSHSRHFARRLTSLSLHRFVRAGDDLIQRLATACPSLTRISLTSLYAPALTDDALFDIASSCPRLACFELDMSDSVTDVGIATLLHRCRSISELTIARVPLFCGCALRYGGEALTKLALSYCDSLDLQELHESLQKAPQVAANLRGLSISDYPGCSHELALFPTMLELCTRLEELRLNNFDLLDNDAEQMQKMGRACPRLRVLEMRECDQVELQGWRALARSLPMLEHLDVTGSPYFCEESLIAVLRGCPTLRSITLSRNFPHAAALDSFKCFRSNVQIRLD
ncbi:hypothetical protein L7F22_061049 [Adiantum nelumboides]|nr:hypothetical protein [Adiantum nelumboides]